MMNVKEYWILPMHEKNTIIGFIAPLRGYSYDADKDIYLCSYCDGAGLFPDGNGGILHKSDCPAGLVRRLGLTVVNGWVQP